MTSQGRRHPIQQELRFRTHGGKRERLPAGAANSRRKAPHRARPTHDKTAPCTSPCEAHGATSLRKQSVFLAIRRALAKTAREWFRVVHFSVQTDHIHMIVEGDDKIFSFAGYGRARDSAGAGDQSRSGSQGKCVQRSLPCAPARLSTRSAACLRLRPTQLPKASRSRSRYRSSELGLLVPAAGSRDLRRNLQVGRRRACAGASPRTWLARKGWQKRRIDRSVRPTKAGDRVALDAH